MEAGDSYELVEASITNKETVINFVANTNIIYHQAAKLAFARVSTNPQCSVERGRLLRIVSLISVSRLGTCLFSFAAARVLVAPTVDTLTTPHRAAPTLSVKSAPQYD